MRDKNSFIDVTTDSFGSRVTQVSQEFFCAVVWLREAIDCKIQVEYEKYVRVLRVAHYYVSEISLSLLLVHLN